MVFRISFFLNSWTPGVNSKESIKIHVLRVPGIMFSLLLRSTLWSEILSLFRLWLLSVCFTIDFKFFLLWGAWLPLLQFHSNTIILDCELSLIFARIKSEVCLFMKKASARELSWWTRSLGFIRGVVLLSFSGTQELTLFPAWVLSASEWPPFPSPLPLENVCVLCSCYWLSLKRSLKPAPVESWCWSAGATLTVGLPVFMRVSQGRDSEAFLHPE